MTISILLAAGFILLVIAVGVRVINEYERGVVLRLGKYQGNKTPGLTWIIPMIDQMVKVDLRTIAKDVPPQDIITKDNVSVKVNAVIYFRVVHPEKAILEVENYLYATTQMAQTNLRSTLGQVELDELLGKSDVILLHAPLNDKTYHIINRKTLEKMKKGSVLINTARGGLVDTEALVEALKSGKIAGAGLDLIENVPPLGKDHPLLKFDNVIITPYYAWYTEDSAIVARETIAREIARVLKGYYPKILVNPENRV